jgi:hypothetical protein
MVGVVTVLLVVMVLSCRISLLQMQDEDAYNKFLIDPIPPCTLPRLELYGTMLLFCINLSAYQKWAFNVNGSYQLNTYSYHVRVQPKVQL